MPRPPKHLAFTEARLWADTVKEYAFVDQAQLAQLTVACEQHQLARECRERIQSEGLTPGGKPHPLLVTMRDARKGFGVAMRQLELKDDEPKKFPGRRPYAV